MKVVIMLQIQILLWLFFMLISTSKTAFLNKHKLNYEKIVMDVDAGADDAFAIQIILKSEKYFQGPPLIALTCVSGNTHIKNVKINVLRTLQHLKKTDIPVYLGASEPLFSGISIADDFFGKDGFGDNDYDSSTLGKVQREHAVTALIRLVSSNPGQITLIATGPLTNIALALKLDPSFLMKLKKLIIGGGSVTGIGNIRPGIEFNFMKDPEAVRIVLSETSYKRTVLFPWDVVVNANISKEWRFDVLGALSNDDIVFLNTAEKVTRKNVPTWDIMDPMLAASYVWPSIIKSMKPLRVTAITSGEGRGGLLVDHYFSERNISSSNLNVVTAVDRDLYMGKLMDLYRRK